MGIYAVTPGTHKPDKKAEKEETDVSSKLARDMLQSSPSLSLIERMFQSLPSAPPCPSASPRLTTHGGHPQRTAHTQQSTALLGIIHPVLLFNGSQVKVRENKEKQESKMGK